MSSSKGTTVAIVGVAVCCVAVCCSVGAYLYLNKPGPSNLPDQPVQAPGVVFKGARLPGLDRDPTLQDVINQMFKVESDCYEVLYLFKVSLPRLLVKYSSVLDKALSWAQTRKLPSRSVLRQYKDILERALREAVALWEPCLNCDPSATFSQPNFDGSIETNNVRSYTLKGTQQVNEAIKQIQQASI